MKDKILYIIFLGIVFFASHDIFAQFKLEELFRVKSNAFYLSDLIVDKDTIYKVFTEKLDTASCKVHDYYIIKSGLTNNFTFAKFTPVIDNRIFSYNSISLYNSNLVFWKDRNVKIFGQNGNLLNHFGLSNIAGDIKFTADYTSDIIGFVTDKNVVFSSLGYNNRLIVEDSLSKVNAIPMISIYTNKNISKFSILEVDTTLIFGEVILLNSRVEPFGMVNKNWFYYQDRVYFNYPFESLIYEYNLQTKNTEKIIQISDRNKILYDDVSAISFIKKQKLPIRSELKLLKYLPILLGMNEYGCIYKDSKYIYRVYYEPLTLSEFKKSFFRYKGNLDLIAQKRKKWIQIFDKKNKLIVELKCNNFFKFILANLDKVLVWEKNENVDSIWELREK